MAYGPGKYDSLATLVRRRARARAVIVLVMQGDHGNGFSVQGDDESMRIIVPLLRTMADDIEKDLESNLGRPG